jgi:hypothetical protein
MPDGKTVRLNIFSVLDIAEGNLKAEDDLMWTVDQIWAA